jgi:hypothetical protein
MLMLVPSTSLTEVVNMATAFPEAPTSIREELEFDRAKYVEAIADEF